MIFLKVNCTAMWKFQNSLQGIDFVHISIRSLDQVVKSRNIPVASSINAEPPDSTLQDGTKMHINKQPSKV
jgi:hypothetical protein